MAKQDFNAKADAGMRKLKDQMGLKHSSVSDRQPNEDPPEGSYAAQILAQQREAARERASSTGEGVTGDVAPSAPEDGEREQSPEVDENGKPVQFNKHPIYGRFKQVSEESQERKARIQELEQAQAKRDMEVQRLQEQLQSLQEQHTQILQQNLESLDPEQRQAVLIESRMRNVEQEIARRVDERIQPALQMIRTQARSQEFEHVARKYPRFDADKHVELIDTVQRVNPGLTVEMAFKAIADPDELMTNGQSATPSPLPPVVTPGRNGMGQPRFMRQSDEDRTGEKLRDGAKQVRDLATSNDPRVRSSAMKAAADSIRDRLLR